MDLQRIAVLIVMTGMITTALLPGRQTVPVLNAISNLFRGSLATAMGTGKRV